MGTKGPPTGTLAQAEGPSECRVRPAAQTDAQALFDLRNDPAIRAWYFDESPVSWSHHLTWFEEHMRKETSRIFVAEDSAVIGSVRYDVDAVGTADVSICVAQIARRRGIATALLRATIPVLLASGFCKRVKASIRLENAASITTFLRAGFLKQPQVSNERVVLLIDEAFEGGIR